VSYIEREALREAFIKHFDAVYDDGKLVFSDHICTAEDCEDILKLVAEFPAADVVPVVRCKDCIHHQNEWCEILKAESPVEDGFCCYGERWCEE
jgi:hypothetical protein